VLLLSILVGGLVACAPGYDVRVDSDPTIDYAAYKTFSIPRRTAPDTPDVLDNALVRKRLEAMFATNLVQRGLTPAASDAAADLQLRYWIATERKTDVDTVPASPLAGPALYPYPYPYPSGMPYWGGRWGPMYQEIVVRDYTEGTLVVDLVDAKRDDLIWRAYVVGTLSRERETVYERVEEALGRAFADYPPRPRKGGDR
jgi:hypothetical protein